MYITSNFDRLPNEIYLLIFDYLNSIDILYSFSNVNRRLNSLLKTYSYTKWKFIDLTKLTPHVFKYYCLQKRLINEIYSIKLTDEQFDLIQFSSTNQVRQLNVLLENNYHLYSNEQFILKNLKKLIIEQNALTWQKPLMIAEKLTEVLIHLKTHADLIELLNCLPIVEKVHATINYEVTSSNENNSLNLMSCSNKLIDFSYIIHSHRGLVYFVTDYDLIEFLIKQMKSLINLRLYIIGCLNTIIDGSRLENNIFNSLPKLKQFHFFLQSYGGKRIKSMDEYKKFQWNFASYTNDLTDMHFLFTLPYQFQRLDECLNEYFINSIQTTFQRSKDKNVNDKLFGLNNIKHVDLSCNLTLNLLNELKESFQSLESIRFSSSTAEYLSPPSLYRQSRYYLNSIRNLTFDQTCKNQSAFVRLLPNLNKLILNQNLLNILLDETGSGYVCRVTHLQIYSFQRHYLENIIDSFPNIRYLKLKTLLTDDEGPVRSYIDCRCHHKHRPVSIVDVLDELLKGKLRRLKQIEIGCYFERDEINIEPILSRIIRKHRNETHQFHIKCENYKSTRCGTGKILFF
ncbi:unnamed protein product [Adineta steineri]|uniref:F-box domain-containing protein n=1 Tax=Adineta steineri TaxID=433720 RepID=A0A814UST0_9BILA|nr:unnamed protein product [Adineta steineri]CAF3737548.1 unnamed protein product [Adineta steineri]